MFKINIAIVYSLSDLCYDVDFQLSVMWFLWKLNWVAPTRQEW